MLTEHMFLSPLGRQLVSRAIAWVTRWHREPVIHRDESDAEHHSLTGRIAYEVGLMLVEVGYKVRPERLMVVGNYHDETEIITGDAPKGLKHGEIIDTSEEVFEDMEQQAVTQLWTAYPDFLTKELRKHAARKGLSDVEFQVIKYADSLSAFGFILDEASFGNELMGGKADTEWETLQSYEWPWLAKLRETYKVP